MEAHAERSRAAPVALGLVFSAALWQAPVQAAGEVHQVSSHRQAATPITYAVDGVQYRWGTGTELILDGLYYQGHRYNDFAAPDRIEVRRVDRPGVATGEPCGLFAEHDRAADVLLTSYPLGSGGNCDVVAMLAGDVINRGALDVFSNIGPAPKNIERLDFIYAQGLAAPLLDRGLDYNGHLVGEKRGNNPVQIAAITALDGAGEPAAFGPLVMIEAAGCSGASLCYGVTPVRHRYSFLQSESLAPQRYARRLDGETENLAIAFVTLRTLGLRAGQRYFGFALFGRDVDPARHDLLDPASYPADTADNHITPGDGADLYGGLAGFYHTADAPTLGAGSAVSGATFLDANGNAQRDPGEAALPGITMVLSAVGATPSTAGLPLTITTDSTGHYLLPGLPDGDYQLQIDTGAAGFPSGFSLPPQSDPVIFSVAGADQALDISLITMAGDGSGPTAVDDRIDALSGQQSTLDVLANDLDPAGGGLSISALTQPAHGSVGIVDNALVYTPDASFVGDDSFSYTVADSGGATDTGTVNAAVGRYSDLDGDGINDYEQCGGCSEIGLITGLDGVGAGGGGGAWLLPLLLGGALCRRRHPSRPGEGA